MNIYELKVSSVHLSSVKLICPNSRVIQSRVLISIINFEKAAVGFFPCRANVSHKNENPNLTLKI